MKRIFVVAALIVLSALGCFERDQIVSDTGTVVFVALEGGFFGIIDDHQRQWDPSNLPKEFQTDSLRVRFEGVITDRPTFHMWGRTVELTSIKRIE